MITELLRNHKQKAEPELIYLGWMSHLAAQGVIEH